MMSTFNEAEIRTAERALEAALGSSDPTAWVYAYTEDAVFVAPGAPAVEGREALLEMARSMEPMSAVVIEARRTEGSENLACVYGVGSWASGRPANIAGRAVEQFVIVWRKEADGQWRVALEMLIPLPTTA